MARGRWRPWARRCSRSRSGGYERLFSLLAAVLVAAGVGISAIKAERAR